MGFLSGVLSTKYVDWTKEKCRRRQLSSFVGEYVAYEKMKTSDEINYEARTGECSIYLDRGELQIIHRENGGDNVWRGTIALQDRSSGEIRFRYMWLHGKLTQLSHFR